MSKENQGETYAEDSRPKYKSDFINSLNDFMDNNIEPQIKDDKENKSAFVIIKDGDENTIIALGSGGNIVEGLKGFMRHETGAKIMEHALHEIAMEGLGEILDEDINHVEPDQKPDKE